MAEWANWKPMEYLQRLHTRQLLGLLQRCRQMPYGYDVFENDTPFYITGAQVKQVLATREHIPNKQEAKKLRQERAKFVR